MRGSPHPGQPVMGHLLPIQECTVVGVNVPSGVDQVRINPVPFRYRIGLPTGNSLAG